MSKKAVHSFLAILAFSLFFLLPIRADAASYQLVMDGSNMTCVDLKTGNLIKSSFVKLKGYTYYFDASGKAHTGWLKKGQNYYFFNANGAMLKNAWVNQYYFQSDGKMAVSKWIDKKTYVGTDGRRIPGYNKKVKAKFVKTSKGTKYRNYDGTYSKKTWQNIKGKWYYFYSNGYMAKSRKIGRFYVDKKGQMVVNKSVRLGKYRYFYGSDGQQVKRIRIKR